MENRNIYINSFEGAVLWEHMNKGRYLKNNFCGMLPFSRHLNKLQALGIKTFTTKINPDKLLSREVINVKFEWSVDNTGQLFNNNEYNSLVVLYNFNKKYRTKLKRLRNKYDKKLQKTPGDAIQKLLNKIDNSIIKKDKIIIEQENRINDMRKPHLYNVDKLRKILYRDGVTITNKNKKTGEIKKIKYVVMSRSSAKSRTGQVLFVKENIRDKIVKYMRLGMNLDNRNDINFPSLLAYESLISSGSEATIKIDTKNIFVVSDVISQFYINCNVVEKDDTGHLVSNPVDNYLMKNDIFDGESLIDISLMESINRENQGMVLLRHHMFKSCAFNTNIQKFLKYNCPKDINYNDWKLKDMFGEYIFAKDILYISTPNSLKFLKFENVKGSTLKMWNHWKYKVNKDDNIFFICKSEHESKRGYDKEGKIINQTSYQMLNSMPIKLNDMKELSRFEVNYISRLKNDIFTYIQYLQDNANEMNSNEMFVDLYSRNNKIMNTEIFRNKRTKDIQKYKEHVKKGKIRLPGDYLTIMQNGKELLYHAIGKLPVNKIKTKKGDYIYILNLEAWDNNMILKKNECYTTLHPFNDEYVAFRNPNTAQSNVLILINKDNEFIKQYFNFTDNIIYANAVDFPLNRILSGQDVDSDSLILFNSDCLLKNAKKCYIGSEESNYRVCVNGVAKDTTPYSVNLDCMATIDNKLATSQRNIGTVVNAGALYMSTYWDEINNGCTDKEKLNKLLQGIDIATILSEVCIDSAKRTFDINIEEQIKYLTETNLLKAKKPLFFEYVSQNDNIQNNIIHYDTAMDYLQNILNKIKKANYNTKTKIEFNKLLKDIDRKKVKARQVNALVKNINDMTKEVKHIRSKYNSDDKEEQKEMYNRLDTVKNKGMNNIKKYKIKAETIYTIIYKVFDGTVECKYKLDLLNALYKYNNEMFLEVFKKK
ncbi:hypothetical protein [Clostridium kluyveri]|uniref:Uncharacterized protein n=1 Tax=Clostridium kluyveri TaxID=1534 RepID=A0A1L5F4P0_CLOKL|nr:hypothetical protein [Clostridium kluyveri]APM37800.1 hypothetical protein BS101_03095 [Clostridium kluyveri]